SGGSCPCIDTEVLHVSCAPFAWRCWRVRVGLAPDARPTEAPAMRRLRGWRPSSSGREPLRPRGVSAGGVSATKGRPRARPGNTRLKSQLVAAYAQRAEAKRRKPGGAAGLAAAEKDLRAAHELAPDDAGVTRSLASILVERAAFESDDALADQLRAEATAL